MPPTDATPKNEKRCERGATRVAGLCLAVMLVGLLTGCAPKKHIESERNT